MGVKGRKKTQFPRFLYSKKFRFFSSRYHVTLQLLDQLLAVLACSYCLVFFPDSIFWWAAICDHEQSLASASSRYNREVSPDAVPASSTEATPLSKSPIAHRSLTACSVATARICRLPGWGEAHSLAEACIQAQSKELQYFSLFSTFLVPNA